MINLEVWRNLPCPKVKVMEISCTFDLSYRLLHVNHQFHIKVYGNIFSMCLSYTVFMHIPLFFSYIHETLLLNSFVTFNNHQKNLRISIQNCKTCRSNIETIEFTIHNLINNQSSVSSPHAVASSDKQLQKP